MLQELASSQLVRDQRFLNVTAIQAFADLARKAQVNNVTAHNRFPVHAFGRLSSVNLPALTDEYLPYMAQKLKNAVREADSHKIQVYIRALGNLGHPKILSVFEPYLEGKVAMSDFQRLLMVISLDKLVRVYPVTARKVLFNIYQNTGEAHELRCAAVFQLMKANPPAYMLQRMAEFTNYDLSTQVNAAVKSSIQTAAQMFHTTTGGLEIEL
jgi:Lipoprotein amino terminal region